MDAISEARLDGLYPPLAEKYRALDAEMTAQGISIRLIQGLRTLELQAQLYAQGRTAPGHIVTNIAGARDYHVLGMAFDAAPGEFGPDQPYSPDWNASHPSWRAMIAAGEKLGLNCGADWCSFKDMPHFQLTGIWPEGEAPEQAEELYASGLAEVWSVAFGAFPS